MNILVTGCNGQLGNEMQLLEKEYPQHSWFNTDVEELDITSQLAVEQFVAQHQIDGIVNCAAYTAVDKAEDNKEQCTTLNTVAPSYLAAAVEKRGGWLVQISTDYVFNGEGDTPWQPDQKDYAPLNVYGQSKLDGELAVANTLDKFFIVRIAWVFGQNGKNFIKTMLKVAETHDEVRVVNDQIGTPTYTIDLARLLVDMIETEKYGIYHATNEGYISWSEFAKKIFEYRTLALFRL
jgi:dTDP-4-dehydrorhamnose reductase